MPRLRTGEGMAVSSMTIRSEAGSLGPDSTAQADSAVPLRFSPGGNQGLSILAVAGTGLGATAFYAFM